MSEDWARDLVQQYERSRAAVVELAELASLAIRIEPELLRALRLRLAPHLDVGAEGDLWFSRLVQARGADGIAFFAEVVEVLQSRLREERHRLERAWEITQDCHQEISPALRLEEEVTYHAVSGAERDVIEKALAPALVALTREGRSGLASWAARALPRLPAEARSTPYAWLLSFAAARSLKKTILMAGEVPADLIEEDLTSILPDLEEVDLGVRRKGDELELGQLLGEGVSTIRVGDTVPRLVELRRQDGEGERRELVSIALGSIVQKRVGLGEVRLRTLTNKIYELNPWNEGRILHYDVFLSFRAEDQREVEKIAEFLRAHSILVFFAPWSIRPGENWLEAVAAGFQSSRNYAVFLGGSQVGPWQEDERALAFLRQKRDPSFRVIQVLLPGLRDSDLPLSFLDLHSRIDLRRDPDRGLDALLYAIHGELPERVGTTTRAIEYAICPYRDLLPYREEDAQAFFGQEEIGRHLENLIRNQPFTALVGRSGCGKTSLVQAGLLPRLRTEESGKRDWTAVTVRPDGDPLIPLCSALASWISQDLAQQAEYALKWERDIRIGATGVSQLIRIVLTALRARRMLLIIDPGEDLLVRSSPETSLFLQEIFNALGPLTVLLILRADHYGQALKDPILGMHLPDKTVLMPLMSRFDLEHTIRNLGSMGNLALRPALVAELVNAVEQAPAGLSLLQRALTKLWQRQDQDPGLVYAEIGLLRGVASALAEEALAASMADERVACGLFLRLVHLDDDSTPLARIQVFREEIDPAFDLLAESLVEKRVLVAGWNGSERKPTLELGYDELLHGWERLQRWISDDRPFLLWRQRLRWKRRDWAHGRHAPELLLLDKQSLEVARAWRDRRPDDLVAIEKRYIEDSEVEYQRRMELEAPGSKRSIWDFFGRRRQEKKTNQE